MSHVNTAHKHKSITPSASAVFGSTDGNKHEISIAKEDHFPVVADSIVSMGKDYIGGVLVFLDFDCANF